jgi:glycosyltransferase involved in cell wall biosynthesis
MKQTRPTRIAFVSDAIYPYHKGGKEKRLHEITTRLAAQGHDVHVYTMKWWTGKRHIVRDGVHLHAISKLYPLYKNDKRSTKQAIGFGFAVYKMLFHQFDVIDVDSMPFFPLYSARLVCNLKRKKLNATWHEVTPRSAWQAYTGPISGLIAYMIERTASRLPDRIISNSEHTTDRLKAQKLNCEIITVPLGINLDFIYSAPTSKIKTDVFFAGRLIPHKNVDVLIRAMKIVKPAFPGAKCLIVGNGPEKANLQQLISDLDLKTNVKIVDFKDDASEMFGLMKASKMFVLPSTREGFSLVAIEANAAGLPVITTNHRDNNAQNLVQNGVNGFVTDLTPGDLAIAIMKILLDTTALNPTVETARYDWAKVTTKIEIALGV